MFKIQVLLNRIPIPYKEDFNKAQRYFADHGVDIIFSYKTTDITGYKSIKSNTFAGGQQYVLDGVKVNIDKSFDCTIFAFDIMEWKTPVGSAFPLLPTTPSGRCVMALGKPFIMLPISPLGSCYITLIHELMHFLTKTFNCKDVMDSYRLNSTPENPNSNFNEQWSLLKPYLKGGVNLPPPLTPMYKYFKLNESTGGGHTIAELKPKLVEMVDRARGRAGFAFIPTSGYRTPEENAKKGGVAGSAHVTREAMDIKAETSEKRYRIFRALILEGFERIGISEKDGFVHCDVSETLPKGIWFY